MADRDPRTDPQLLDLVKVGKLERCVEYITVLGTVVYSTALSHGNYTERRCSLAAWKKWARGGTVKPARTPSTHRSTCLVKLDEGAVREINRLRNRLDTVVPGYRASEEELVAGLMNLALALLERHPTHEPRALDEDDLRTAIVALRGSQAVSGAT